MERRAITYWKFWIPLKKTTSQTMKLTSWVPMKNSMIAFLFNQKKLIRQKRKIGKSSVLSSSDVGHWFTATVIQGNLDSISIRNPARKTVMKMKEIVDNNKLINLLRHRNYRWVSWWIQPYWLNKSYEILSIEMK